MATDGITGLLIETDHHSGQLRHPQGGPYLFIAVVHPFAPQHYPALEMLLADPGGRDVRVHAPLPETAGHG
jgi:hypothetical protein